MYSRVLFISIPSQRKGELSPHLARARDCLAVSTVDQENTVVWALHSSPPSADIPDADALSSSLRPNAEVRNVFRHTYLFAWGGWAITDSALVAVAESSEATT